MINVLLKDMTVKAPHIMRLDNHQTRSADQPPKDRGLPIDCQLESLLIASSIGLKWYSSEYTEQSANELEALDWHRTQTEAEQPTKLVELELIINVFSCKPFGWG